MLQNKTTTGSDTFKITLDGVSSTTARDPLPPGIGHNNPPPDPPRATAWTSDPPDLPKLEDVKFAQQIEAIIDSDYTAIQKLVLMKLRLGVDQDTFAHACLGNATLMQAASVKDERTIREAIRALITDGIAAREVRSGRSPAYALSKERLQEVIADYIVANRGKLRQRQAKSHPSKRLPSDVGRTSDGRAAPPCCGEKGNHTYPAEGVSADPLHNQLGDKPYPNGLVGCPDAARQ
jgi:hypothetical protein